MAKKYKAKFNIDEATTRVTQWMGSTASIVVHTVAFIAIFLLYFVGLGIDQIMLILTTIVSLEAIYLSLFIQMTVNRNTASLEEVEEDLDEIQADIDEVQTTVDDLEEEVDDISADVDEISADIDDIQAEDNNDTVEDKNMRDKNNRLHDSINTNIISLTQELQKLQKEIESLKTISGK